MRVHGILEACVYADDLERVEAFYVGVLRLVAFAREPGRHVFFRTGGPNVFLVFNPERTTDTVGSERAPGAIPPHGSRGPGHVCFTIAESDVASWRNHLMEADVTIESEVSWPGGGRSLYIRDPAGNSVELATSRIWGLEW
jgi:catechol 2,3-dioxygenase-like lactoylglutathione lyase family enzyme